MQLRDEVRDEESHQVLQPLPLALWCEFIGHGNDLITADDYGSNKTETTLFILSSKYKLHSESPIAFERAHFSCITENDLF